METASLDIIEKEIKNENEADRYQNVFLKIKDVIKQDIPDNKRDAIINILKDNFNVKDEMLGRVLMQDVLLFDPETGYDFNIPLCFSSLFYPFGVQIVSPKLFPNYDIENKYIGYTENGKFYRNTGMRKFIRHVKKEPFWYLFILLLYYTIVTTIIKFR